MQRQSSHRQQSAPSKRRSPDFRAGAPEQSGLAAHGVMHETQDKGCGVRCMPPSRQSGQGDEDRDLVATWPHSRPQQEGGRGLAFTRRGWAENGMQALLFGSPSAAGTRLAPAQWVQRWSLSHDIPWQLGGPQIWCDLSPPGHSQLHPAPADRRRCQSWAGGRCHRTAPSRTGYAAHLQARQFSVQPYGMQIWPLEPGLSSAAVGR